MAVHSDLLFRGIIAPASLKRRIRAPIGDLRSPFPGHHRPGLIEAGPRVGSPTFLDLAPFPGHHRPGLIEAWLAEVRDVNTGELFRGIIAPASLKRGTPRWHVPPCEERLFRGIIAPASLKRPVQADAVVVRGRLFRGIIAPASLKQIDSDLVPSGQVRLFRGIIAPASLKLDLLGGEAHHGADPPFPGHHRPGLIEAGGARRT